MYQMLSPSPFPVYVTRYHGTPHPLLGLTLLLRQFFAKPKHEMTMQVFYGGGKRTAWGGAVALGSE
jgi:hypothetical protein